MQRLFPAVNQFELKDGHLNVAGQLNIFYEGTDDRADIFDEDGTQLAQPVILDNNGRSRGLFVDGDRVYRLEVLDSDGGLLYTVRKMTPCGGGDGSGTTSYTVVSSDGTVKVTKHIIGNTIAFDLSADVHDEPSNWAGRFDFICAIDGDSAWHELEASSFLGTMEYDGGYAADKDFVADIAASVQWTQGDADATRTVDLMAMFTVDGSTVSTQEGQVDPTEPRGRVSFHWKGEVEKGQVLDCRLFARCAERVDIPLSGRVYINEECDGIVGGGGGGGGGTSYAAGDYVDPVALAADIISVTGVQPQSGMTAYQPVSAMDDYAKTTALTAYVTKNTFNIFSSDVTNDITAISAAITGCTGATGDYVQKSSISAQSAQWNEVSAKLDSSAFNPGDFYPMTGNPSGFLTSVNMAGYATTAYVDSAVSSKLDSTAFNPNAFYPSGNPSGFITGVDLSNYATTAYVDSSVSGKLDSTAAYTPTFGYSGTAISSIDGSSLAGLGGGGHTYTGISPVVVNNLNDTISLSTTGLGVDGDTMSAWVSGDDVVIGVKPGTFQPSGDYISATESSNFITTSQSSQFITSTAGLAYESSVSAKMDASASSNFYPMTGNPSGFITGVDLSNYATTAYVDSSISGKLDSSSQVVTAIGVAAGAISSINNYGISAGTANSAGTALHDSAGRALTSMATKAEASGIANAYASGKLDESAFSSVSGTFLTSVDLSPYQTTADMSGYLQTSESANYYPVNNPSGFITGVDLSDYATTAYVDSSVSSKLDSTAFDPDAFYPSGNPSGFITGVDLSDYATTAYVDSSVSGKLDASATSDFYSTSNPSGFLTAAYSPTFGYDGTAISSIDGSALAGGGGVDSSTVSAIASAYAESAASSKLDSTATSDFYSTSNPSGFITGVDLSDYATTAYVDSSVSSKLDASATSDFYPMTGNPSGFLTAAYAPTFGYSGTAISSIDGSAVYDVSAQDGITALSAEIGDIYTILQSI